MNFKNDSGSVLFIRLSSLNRWLRETNQSSLYGMKQIWTKGQVIFFIFIIQLKIWLDSYIQGLEYRDCKHFPKIYREASVRRNINIKTVSKPGKNEFTPYVDHYFTDIENRWKHGWFSSWKKFFEKKNMWQTQVENYRQFTKKDQ